MQKQVTIKSFVSKDGYNKVKRFFALRVQKKGTIKGFVRKAGYNQEENFVPRVQKKGYNKKLAKHAGVLEYNKSLALKISPLVIRYVKCGLGYTL